MVPLSVPEAPPVMDNQELLSEAVQFIVPVPVLETENVVVPEPEDTDLEVGVADKTGCRPDA